MWLTQPDSEAWGRWNVPKVLFVPEIPEERHILEKRNNLQRPYYYILQ